jgi:hypothetical protein
MAQNQTDIGGYMAIDYCFICGKYGLVDKHHIFGNAYRKKSEEYGFIVPLCRMCHTEKGGVHQDWGKNLHLKQIAQTEFERTHTRDDFRQTFGKSYLEDGND